MKRDFILAVLLTIISIFIPCYAFADSLDPTYIIMGGGMLVVFAQVDSAAYQQTH